MRRNPDSVSKTARSVNPAIDHAVRSNRRKRRIDKTFRMSPSRLVAANRAGITWKKTRRIYANLPPGPEEPGGGSGSRRGDHAVELKGCRAAVLGSTSGIGRAVALELAEAGPT